MLNNQISAGPFATFFFFDKRPLVHYTMSRGGTGVQMGPSVEPGAVRAQIL